MKVKELIKRLKQENPESEIVLAADEEGNYFTPLSVVECAIYDPEEHEVYDPDAQDINGENAVILWP